jgi:hypothetical protein
MSTAKLFCWIGLHKWHGWETDYSQAYVPAFSIFGAPGSPITKIKRYRQFNKCERCGKSDCRFTG